MNILTKIRLINELNEKEVLAGTKPEASWHTQAEFEKSIGRKLS